MNLAHDIHWMQIVSAYGYGVIFLVIMLESAGFPLPGETILISAAILAGRGHALSISLVIATAAAAAIAGDNLGFWVGRRAGVPLLRRFGPYVGIGEARIRLGEYIFRRHGGKIVFFGRFVAVLRALAAVLAGANLYPWGRFLAYNAAGGIVWATLFGLGGYIFGSSIHDITGPLGVVGILVAVAAVVVSLRVIRRYEAEWQARADAALGVPAEAKPRRNPNPA